LLIPHPFPIFATQKFFIFFYKDKQKMPTNNGHLIREFLYTHRAVAFPRQMFVFLKKEKIFAGREIVNRSFYRYNNPPNNAMKTEEIKSLIHLCATTTASHRLQLRQDVPLKNSQEEEKETSYLLEVDGQEIEIENRAELIEINHIIEEMIRQTTPHTAS
jgi:hypothetical protein